MLDAGETLAHSRPDGRLDGAAFEAVFGDLVRGTAATGQRAVLHAWSDLAVGLCRTDDGIRITMADACADPQWLGTWYPTHSAAEGWSWWTL